MNVVVIDSKDIELTVNVESIKIPNKTIPFRLIDLLILNHRISITTNDILKINKAGISILIISYNSNNFSLVSAANAKNSEIKHRQYMALNYKLSLAKYFIKQKILSHTKQLEKHNIVLDNKNVLHNIDSADSIATIMGVEGTFAKDYFKKYFSLFSRELTNGTRSKQPPKDVVNALMSYLYGLFYNIITDKLLSNGFDPSIGYLHKAFRSHNALSSDILEIFRSQINEMVFQIFNEKVLEKSDFTFKNGVYLKYSGRKKIWDSFVKLSSIIKPQINKEIAYLRSFIDEKI